MPKIQPDNAIVPPLRSPHQQDSNDNPVVKKKGRSDDSWPRPTGYTTGWGEPLHRGQPGHPDNEMGM